MHHFAKPLTDCIAWYVLMGMKMKYFIIIESDTNSQSCNHQNYKTSKQVKISIWQTLSNSGSKR